MTSSAMSMSAVSVRVPGGLGETAGGGSKDPRKPGGEPPGRSHQQEKTTLTPEQKAERKRKKRAANLATRRHEGEAEKERHLDTDLEEDLLSP